MKKNGKVTNLDLPDLMTVTMGFAPLKEEVEFFIKYLNKQNDENISFEEMQSALDRIRFDLNETAKKSVNYSSYGAYCYDCNKHKSTENDPNVVYKSPCTKGMTYGFYKFEGENLNNIHRPINKCPETKYAESRIRSGFN